MSNFLFIYRIAFKVGTKYIPFQLVYILHPLLLTKHMLPSKLRQIHDPSLVRILISHMSELKKLQEN